MFCLYRKLRFLKAQLRRLNREEFSDLSERVERARRDLLRAQDDFLSGVGDSGRCGLERDAVVRFSTLARMEESMLRQKARIRWLELGDRNTAFFFSSVRSRQNRGGVRSLISDDGRAIRCQQELMAEARGYFGSLLSAAPRVAGLRDDQVLPLIRRCTWIWRKLLSMRHLVRDLTAWRMGDGSRISIWYDSWLPTGPLIETLGSRAMERSGVSPVCSVRDFYSATAWMDYISDGSLRLSHVRRCIFDFIRDLVPSSHLPTPSTQDRVIWLPSPGGMFSIASAWRKLRCTHSRVPWADLVWFQGAVPRFAVIEWMVFMERLPIRHHLFSIGVADSSTCCFCQCRRETMDQLFFRCSFSSEV
ncbi:hypothetical protein Droror1_Dr00016131 [Drosera rotundifolia]